MKTMVRQEIERQCSKLMPQVSAIPSHLNSKQNTEVLVGARC